MTKMERDLMERTFLGALQEATMYNEVYKATALPNYYTIWLNARESFCKIQAKTTITISGEDMLKAIEDGRDIGKGYAEEYIRSIGILAGLGEDEWNEEAVNLEKAVEKFKDGCIYAIFRQ